MLYVYCAKSEGGALVGEKLAGVFEDEASARAAAQELSDAGFNVFQSLNEPQVKPYDLCHRYLSDVDFQYKRLLIDLDTEGPLELVIERAKEIAEKLKEFLFPEPTIAVSGNGCHLLYNLRRGPGRYNAQERVRAALRRIDAMFSTEDIWVDTTVYNLARLTRFYGFPNYKNGAKPTYIVSHGSGELTFQTLGQLELETTQTSVDVETLTEWLNDNFGHLDITPSEWSQGRRWVFSKCPWCSATDRSAYVVLLKAGGLAAGCHHSSCSGDWRSLNKMAAANYVSGRQGYVQNRPSSVETPGLTDTGNAKRLFVKLNGKYFYCREMGKGGTWLRFTQGKWVPDIGDGVYAMAQEVVRDLFDEAEDEDEKVAKAMRSWATQSEKIDRLRAMIDLCKLEPGISVGIAEFNNDVWHLNLVNGYLDLRTGELHDHLPEQRNTHMFNARWVPGADCPRFKQFMQEIMLGDQDMVDYLQRYLGYTLTGLTSDQTLLFFRGGGKNGKSVLVKLLMKMFGSYAVTIPRGMLLVKSGFQPNVERQVMSLLKKRLATTVEADRGTHFNEALLKELTGGDEVSGRNLYQADTEFAPTHKIIMAANHQPVIKNTDEGIWRRFRLIPFNYTVPKELVDDSLDSKLLAEADGILQWLFAGLQWYLKSGMNPPDTVKAAVDDYRQDMDLIGEFLTTCVKPGGFTSQAEMFTIYCEWCEANKLRPMTRMSLNRELRERLEETVGKSAGKSSRGWKCEVSFDE